jgi:hypothetical protein
MKLIPLTQGKFALVDDEDYEYLSKFKWHAKKQTRKHFPDYFYAARGKKGILMHREILNISEDQNVDHKNGNGLDNRKENLRPASQLENCRNRRYRDKGLPRGITFQAGKFRARICILGKNISLGMFINIEDATKAYDHASIKLFKEFGIRNGDRK